MAKSKKSTGRKKRDAGRLSKTKGRTLRSFDVGALPIINQFLDRMKLEEILKRYLRRDDRRVKIPTSRGLLLLLRNLLISREPIYGIGDWASGYAPELLGLQAQQLQYLNDDRLGRYLDRLFRTPIPELVMDLVRHVIQEFEISLSELHNDSTSVSVYGAYEDAQEEGQQDGWKTLAITWGFSKDHRPDLKQLLYILTVSNDGGVPVYFTAASGNVVDDQTHRDTWDLLRELAGSADFLYVADCKLATKDNMKYIAGNNGRFITVLPKTRKEDKDFRQRMRDFPERLCWLHVYDITNDKQEVLDRLSVCQGEHKSAEGFRLLWFHSTRKAELDACKRRHHLERTIQELRMLQDRLYAPKTRFRERNKVEQAVAAILQEHEVERWMEVQITERPQEQYRQERRGRPSKETRYVKKTTTRYDLWWEINATQIEKDAKQDGVFPLITNASEMTEEDVLRAYKRQPIIEKRFSQLKTDFEVAPIYLKNVGRIQALLCVYFFVLMVQTLMERELRKAMLHEGIDGIPLYPEDRTCKRPTTRRVIDIFESVQRHTLTANRQQHQFVTELSSVQRLILDVLDVPLDHYRTN